MSEERKKLEWALFFHYTIQRGAEPGLDMYSLRHIDERKKPILITVPAGDKELPKLVEAAMNGLGLISYQPRKHWYEIFTRIFFGPWEYDSLTRQRYIRITQTEERELRMIIFRESAEADMAVANYEKLKKDFGILEQALLRANAARSYDLQEHINDIGDKSMSDLFRDAFLNEAPKLFEDNLTANLGNGNIRGGN